MLYQFCFGKSNENKFEMLIAQCFNLEILEQERPNDGMDEFDGKYTIND